MLPLILLGSIFCSSIAIIACFWDEIKDFVKKTYEKAKTLIHGTIIGFSVFLKTNDIYEGVKAFQKFYFKKSNGKYQEVVYEKEIEEKDLPSDIAKKLKQSKGREIDISQELEMELN